MGNAEALNLCQHNNSLSHKLLLCTDLSLLALNQCLLHDTHLHILLFFYLYLIELEKKKKRGICEISATVN